MGSASFGMSGITTRSWTIRSLKAYDTKALYISRFPAMLRTIDCIWSTVSVGRDVVPPGELGHVAPQVLLAHVVVRPVVSALE